MTLPEFAQLDEENGLLRDQIKDLETERDDLRARSTTHRESFVDPRGVTWIREVTVVEGEWEQQ